MILLGKRIRDNLFFNPVIDEKHYDFEKEVKVPRFQESDHVLQNQTVLIGEAKIQESKSFGSHDVTERDHKTSHLLYLLLGLAI